MDCHVRYNILNPKRIPNASGFWWREGHFIIKGYDGKSLCRLSPRLAKAIAESLATTHAPAARTGRGDEDNHG